MRLLARGKLNRRQGASLTTDRNEYRRGDVVELRARFFDPRVAPSGNEVTVLFQSEGRPRRRITLQRNPTVEGVFDGSLADLAGGQYELVLAEPQLPGKLLVSRFSIVAPPGELARLEMDAATLTSAAETTRAANFTRLRMPTDSSRTCQLGGACRSKTCRRSRSGIAGGCWQPFSPVLLVNGLCERERECCRVGFHSHTSAVGRKSSACFCCLISAPPRTNCLPTIMHLVTEKIAVLQRQLVWRHRATAICWIAATTLTAACVLGLIDYLVRFADSGLRIMASAALLAAAAWAVYYWWLRTKRQRIGQLSVARRVESRFPQLRDALASAVEFLNQPEEDLTAGSAQLRRLVIAEAQSAVEQLPLNDVIDRRPLRRSARWLLAPLIVLALCSLWDATAVQTALVRLVAPLGATEWPRDHHLVFRKVLTRLAVGQDFEVELVESAAQLPADVHIEYRIDTNDGTESSSSPMIRTGDVMIARRDNVRESFSFRAVGGDDRSMPWHRVEVVEPPRLEEFSIVAHPPAYTGLPTAAAEGHLEVFTGTGLEVRGRVSGPLRAARILMDGAKPIAAEVRPNTAGGSSDEFHIMPQQWMAVESGPYQIELTDTSGVAGVAGEWNLRVLDDPPPSVTWQRPRSTCMCWRRRSCQLAFWWKTTWRSSA